MSRDNEKIQPFRNPRTGQTIRSVTSPNGMVTWQRKEVRYISGDSIMGNMEAVLDTFNEACRGMSDESFYGDYGYHQEYEEEKSFRIEVTGWVDITSEEAEKFITDRDRAVSEQEADSREAAQREIERLRRQFPGL